jgi:hypothetical protein
MSEANQNTSGPGKYLGLVAATILALVTIEEGLTKLITGAPLLLTALDSAIPLQNHPTTQPTFGLADYLGDWRNPDPQTLNVTRASLQNQDSSLQLHVWGKCIPTDCDWGTTNATAYAGGVASSEATDVRSVEAIYKNSFDEVTVVLKLTDKSTMNVETRTHFTDNSQRSDYQSTDTLLPNAPASR